MSESEGFNEYLGRFIDLLKLPQKVISAKAKKKISTSGLKDNINNLPFLRRLFDPHSYKFTKDYVKEWNDNIETLAINEKFVKSLERFYDIRKTVASLKQLLFQLVCKLNAEHVKIEVTDVTKLIDQLLSDDKIKLIAGLSVLEICLLIAIKHHCDIYDNDPFNFEIIFTRFCKFSVKSTTMQNIEREMALKRFENLKVKTLTFFTFANFLIKTSFSQYQEFIVPIGADGKVQKEYQMHRSLIWPHHIDNAVHIYQNLPTEVEQWAKSSLV